MFRAIARSVRFAAQESASGASSNKLSLNLVLPHESLFKGKQVDIVTLPGVEGVFGVQAGHIPTITQLKPGTVVVSNEGKEEHYFISGGFAFVHKNSTADVAALEACKVSDLDPAAVKEGLDKSRAAMETAPSDIEKAKAQVVYEVYEAMSGALGAEAKH
eukprot:GILI01001581.1.p1 GENE.GILI01001581.1~~GILI01001581.1.p1  ORF type:complete len:160 (+),score=66.27 GILI01001581.1:65-544(+)